MKKFIAFTLCAFTALLTGTASAGSVDARLSVREAYVGMPIVLQITIADAGDYEQPKMPEIDGCDIRSAGAPSQSSQVTIINGRRSESRSVTMQYLITPRREGTYQIPSLAIDVDGQQMTTNPLRFVATKSVTGDLLFVEIEGGKEKVFVGQPLDLTLKIWLKPYRDTKQNLTLSEADMWQMISEQTSWGGFTTRMKELAENNQRPGGREVLRDDGTGQERSYYLYEIEATVYPKRPGKIDAEDVQIVVNYPTALGKSRSPFGSFFEGSPFGGNSPLSRMMDDDFFASSFGNRLTVTRTRPIVGEVSVDATQVVSVPTEGRPDDYRGAVGRYRIVTKATPNTVDAGDPITLNIGIQGTGPMELVQAPPLYELPSLTADFKVADESLAGVVQNDTKVFSTTIRPRREGIKAIPPIRFSFFDPDTQSYETVMSEPIAITVNKAESLALDAIVGKSRASGGAKVDDAASGVRMQPDFTNSDMPNVLVSQSPSVNNGWWWMFVITPPFVWLAAFLIRHQDSIAGRLPSLRSPHQQCLNAIECATDHVSITSALTDYVARRSGETCHTFSSAMGVLRVTGMYDLASSIESYRQRFENKMLAVPAPSDQILPSEREEAVTLANELEKAFARKKQSRIRLPEQPKKMKLSNRSAQRSLGLLLGVAIAMSAGDVTASQVAPTERMTLSSGQQQTIFEEASQTYAQALETAQSDSADAKQLFETAAEKYQLLVESGIRNSKLYSNLGNAYLQSGELGRAIANYERARRLDPNNLQLLTNLQFANSRVTGQPSPSPEVASTFGESFTQRLRRANDAIVQIIGKPSVIWTLVIASLFFWGLLIARTVGLVFPVWRCAAAPLLILIASLGSVVLSQTEPESMLNAVIVADAVSLRAGDGEQFDEVVSVETAQGHRVEMLGQRGRWSQIRTADGHTGWIESDDVELCQVT